MVLVFINFNFEESGGTNEEDKEVANKNININTLDRRTPSDSDLVSSNLLMQAGFHELNQVQFLITFRLQLMGIYLLNIKAPLEINKDISMFALKLEIL